MSSWPGSLDEALVEAVRKGQFGLVKYLFRLKASWFLGDLQQPLCEAMSRGYIHIMEYLIASAVNVGGQTPLILATIKGDENMVKSVLQAGADVNRTNQQMGKTALVEAASNRCTKIAILLIEAGADMNIVDKSGHAALMLAVRKGNLRIGEVLIKAGAEVDKLCAEGLTDSLYCTLEGTALMLAAQKGYLSITEALIEAGADVNLVSTSGDTALMVAAWNEHLNIMKVLIEAGADVNKICARNETALLQFALNGNVQGVRLLLRSGAKLNIGKQLFWIQRPYITLLLDAAGVCSFR